MAHKVISFVIPLFVAYRGFMSLLFLVDHFGVERRMLDLRGAFLELSGNSFSFDASALLAFVTLRDMRRVAFHSHAR